MIHSITVSELLENNYNYNIIDIRSIQNYNHNHITGAKHVPIEKLINTPYKYMDKNNVYYIYCQKGKNSILVCRKLLLLGYRVVNIEGGYEEWIMKR